MRSLWLALCALARLWPGALAGCAEAGRCCPGRDPACFARGWRLDRVYGTCFCDQACRLTGDCCFDYDRACPGGWRGRGGARGPKARTEAPSPSHPGGSSPSVPASPGPLHPAAPAPSWSPPSSPCTPVHQLYPASAHSPSTCAHPGPSSSVQLDLPPQTPLPPESGSKVRAPSPLDGAGPPPPGEMALAGGGGCRWPRFLRFHSESPPGQGPGPEGW